MMSLQWDSEATSAAAVPPLLPWPHASGTRCDVSFVAQYDPCILVNQRGFYK